MVNREHVGVDPREEQDEPTNPNALYKDKVKKSCPPLCYKFWSTALVNDKESTTAFIHESQRLLSTPRVNIR